MVDAGSELQRLSSIGGLRAGHFIVSQRERSRCGPARLDLNLRRQVSQIRSDALLMDVEIFNAQRIPGFKTHGLPNAFRHEARPPIPAVVVGRLACVGSGGDVLFVSVIMS